MIIINRTKENWTYGALAIPLLYGHNNRYGVNPKTMIRKMNDKARCYNPAYPAIDRDNRYFWYEVDNKAYLTDILTIYKNLGIDVYYHETYNGYHFYSMYIMSKIEHDITMASMNELYNPSFVKNALRIVPNKWDGESEIWHNGYVLNNHSGHMKYLEYIKRAIESPYVFDYNRTPNQCVNMLKNMFAISRYPFKRRLQQ